MVLAYPSKRSRIPFLTLCVTFTLLLVLYYSVIHGLPQFADPSVMPEGIAPIDPNTPPPTLSDLGSFLSSLLEHTQVSNPGLETEQAWCVLSSAARPAKAARDARVQVVVSVRMRAKQHGSSDHSTRLRSLLRRVIRKLYSTQAIPYAAPNPKP